MKEIEKLKTSEVLDKVQEDLGDVILTELDEEILTRPPFDFLMECIKKLEEKTEGIESWKKHQHSKEGKVLVEP